jgi:polyisoprenoid-binding protein YceI
MRRRFGLLGLLLLLPPLPAVAVEWRVDSARSTLAVTFDQGGKPVTAKFEQYEAQVSFDPAAPAASRAEITVDLASFRSGDARRDQMATAGEFLGASSAATATYRATTFKAMGGDRYEVAGELTLKGVTGRLSHPATITVSGNEARAKGEVTLNRVDFGVGAAQFPRGDQVGLTVTVRFDLAAVRAS